MKTYNNSISKNERPLPHLFASLAFQPAHERIAN
jgi:hypothetical protein